jgi:hypothetical protein
MPKQTFYFCFDKATDTPTHAYAAKRIYLQKLSEDEWQYRQDLGAEEKTEKDFAAQDKPKKRPVKKADK